LASAHQIAFCRNHHTLPIAKYAFDLEESTFDVQARRVSADLPPGSDNAVTWDDDGDRIVAHRGPDGTRSIGTAASRSELAIGHHGAIRNLSKPLEHTRREPLLRRQIEGHIEIPTDTSKVFLELLGERPRPTSLLCRTSTSVGRSSFVSRPLQTWKP
jgi:hypothetical protein